MELITYGTRGGMCSSRGTEYGVHTPCICIYVDDVAFVFDLGSGVVELSKDLVARRIKRVKVFMSHYHLDHIMGFPFLSALYDPSSEVTIYGRGESDNDVKQVFANMFKDPYFPVPIGTYAAKLSFKAMPLEGAVSIRTLYEPFEISAMKGNHNGGCLIYKLRSVVKGFNIIYMTDYENVNRVRHAADSCNEKQLMEFMKRANVLIAGAQFTEFEYPLYKGQGHSTIEEMLALADACNIKLFFLTHIDSRRSTEEIKSIHNLYKYGLKVKNSKLLFEIAQESKKYRVDFNTCKIKIFNRQLN